jgi:gamma-glutamyltranspeptidase/glutathione hydrolase
MRRLFLLIASLLLVSLTASTHAQTTWRPTVIADNGMVASGHPLASEAGLRMLRAGGNAVDAALATWAVQGLTEPEMTGLGSDMFILIYLAKTGEVKFINGTGFAPMAATVDFYKSKGGMPDEGPLSVSVPGAVGAVELAAKTYGTRPLSEIFATAIELADRGFPISANVAASLRSNREKLARVPSTTRIWFNGDRPLEMGERVVQKDLAATLRDIAAKGSAAFYQGTIAQKTVAYMNSVGGILAEKDLAAYKAFEDAPIHINYKGVEVYECPPNSQGHVMLQALNILEGMNVRYMRHNSAPYLHAVAEALKLSFADRNRWNGDPRMVPEIPIRELLSKEYAAVRRGLIDPDRAIQGEAPAGDPRRPTSTQQIAYSAPRPPSDFSMVREVNEDGHTTYLAVVDKDRNMVSITSSLLSLFGSGHVVDGAGFFLNNRMAYFGLEPDDVNVLKPGKRVRQTINPALALREGKPYMTFGTPGADTQPQAQLQFFLNVVEFGMSVQQALEQPYIVTTNFKSSYYPHNAAGTLQIPALVPKHVLDELTSMGHKLDVNNGRGVGSVKAIVVHPKSGALMGGVSPTRDSYVMAY